jgi:hypothetical protein
MSIEIHFITAIVRKDAVARLHKEDVALVMKALRWDQGLFREDANLMATEFASGDEARAFAEDLDEAGIQWVEEGPEGAQVAMDAVMVDQNTGPTVPCPWIDLANLAGIPAASVRGRDAGPLAQVPYLEAEPELRQRASTP